MLTNYNGSTACVNRFFGQQEMEVLLKATIEQQSPRQIADRLHSAAIHLLRRVRKQDERMGEGPARLSALSVLVFGGPTTLGHLAAAEQVSAPTMSRIVAGLKRSGLATAVTDATDARRIRIQATAKGVRLMQEGRKRRIDSLTALISGMGAEELAILSRTVDLLERALKR